jgi:cytoskeletal protein RodZ
VPSKRKYLIIVISTVVVGLCMIAFIWWAEASWISSRKAYETSSSATSSSVQTSANGNSDSSHSEETNTGLNTAESSSVSKQSSQGSESSNDANDPGDGVARDSSSPAKSTLQGNGKTVAQVQLTWWDAGSAGITANGAVNNVVENSGSCTLNATQGAVTRTASTQAIANATTTSCGELQIPRTELSTGDWTLTLSYSSASAAGQSSAQTVHIA